MCEYKAIYKWFLVVFYRKGEVMTAIVYPLGLYLIPTLMLGFLGFEIWLRHKKSVNHRIAFVFMLATSMYYLGEYTRALVPIEYSEELLRYWQHPAAILGWCTMVHFYFCITRYTEKLKKPLYLTVSYLPMLLIGASLILGDRWDHLIFRVSQAGIWKPVYYQLGYYIIWAGIVAYMIFIFNMLYLSIRRADNKQERLMRRTLMKCMAFVFMLYIGSLLLCVWLPGLKNIPSSQRLIGDLFFAISLRWVMLKHNFLPSYSGMFKTLYELSPAGILLLDDKALIREANQEAGEVFSSPAQQLKDMPVYELVSKSKQHAFMQVYNKFFARKRLRNNIQLKMKNRRGETIFTLIDADFIKYENEHLMLAIIRNVTAVKQSEIKRQEAERQQKKLAEKLEIVTMLTSDAFFDWDLAKNKLEWSERIYQLLKLPSQMELQVNEFQKWIHPEDVHVVKQAVAYALKDNYQMHIEVRLRRGDGQWIWVSSTALVKRNPQGKAMRMIGAVTDITERKETERRIEYLAYHDTLTGLPNRLKFQQKMDETIKQANKYMGMAGVLLIDLDRFKLINDTLGHQSGDQVLQIMSARLQTAVSSDGLVARLGGDEFIILLYPNKEDAYFSKVADRVLHCCLDPIFLPEQEFIVGASIGGSLYPQHGKSHEQLVKHADIAMYRAKENGGNRIEWYNQQMNLKIQRRMDMEAKLRKAVENHEFVIYYQPQYGISADIPFGMEALLRWHSDDGVKLPESFIDLAEEIGIMHQIGDIVLRNACLQIHQWNSREQWKQPLALSVNISWRHFSQPEFTQNIVRILEETGLPPSLLCLELKESMILQHLDLSKQVLQEITDAGIRIALDDFGTAYSTWSLLRQLPVQVIKIDRSFIWNMLSANEDHSMVNAILNLSAGLGKEVIAEGVETVEQWEHLKELGCEKFQGYNFSLPKPAQEIEALLQKACRAKFI